MSRRLRNIWHAGRDVIGINQRNLELIYPNNPRKYFFLADDKAETKQLLEKKGVPVPSTYAIIERTWEIDAMLERVSDQKDIVVKPSNGSGGNGILLLQRNGENGWTTPGGRKFGNSRLQMHIASILYGAYAHDRRDRCIIEQRVAAHSALLKIYPGGIADVRIIMDHHEPLMGMLRIPTDRSGGKANLHQGAMGVGIELSTGKILQGFYRNRITDTHPDSGIRFSGMTVPCWEQVLSVSREASLCVPLKYLGVDIMIDMEKGPLVIEINARPGLQIQNANMQGLGKLLREKYG